MLCSAVKHVQEAVEYERSVGENMRRNRVFCSLLECATASRAQSRLLYLFMIKYPIISSRIR